MFDAAWILIKGLVGLAVIGLVGSLFSKPKPAPEGTNPFMPGSDDHRRWESINRPQKPGPDAYVSEYPECPELVAAVRAREHRELPKTPPPIPKT